jgi:ribosomal protein S18 acetylase RimI-like enzyme
VTLPDPLKAFWYAIQDLSATVRRTPWGIVATDHRYPRVWDANHASILEDPHHLTIAQVRDELLPALGQAGVDHEHIELWDPPADGSLIGEIREGGERLEADVVMVLEPSATAHPVTSAVVRELIAPDHAFWNWYRGTRNEFGHELPDEVVDQLVRRDREVIAPAGLRWFVGYIDGEMAGFASLLSMAGVGYVDNVVTVPAYRRRGVASATVMAAAQASGQQGDSMVHLLAEANARPQLLYERLGFRVRANVLSFTRALGHEGPQPPSPPDI